jgi:hypothetical protein
VETRATFGAPVEQPALVQVDRRNGVCRDRLNALTRKTHAFAKTTTTWDALLDVHIFEQTWLHPHLAFWPYASRWQRPTESTISARPRWRSG